MAARKLQTEIDRTLKKVSEGVELFEGIYDKMQNSTNQPQKEKLETDLKTQIKKLQRLRDQIKTWVASNDIKDKTALLDNRRLIETQMEKFKACEKEMKTKAFSKEGLIQAAKLDPKEQEKEEAASWLQTQVEELQMQVEASEAEIESLQGSTGKKRNKAGGANARVEELETLNERRKWHIGRLEIVLRLLQNGTMPTEKVNTLKDDVQYFVESNTEEDFDEDEGIYDELNLDEEEEKFNGRLGQEDEDADESDSASDDIPPRPVKKHSTHHEEETPSQAKPQESPILKKASIQTRKQSLDSSKPPPNPNFSANPMSSVVSRNLPSGPSTSAPAPTTRAPTLPPTRYAAVAASAVPPLTPSATQPATPSIVPPSAPPTGQPSTASHPPQSSQDSIAAPESPSVTHPSVSSPILSSASVSQQPDGSMYSAQDSPAMSEAVPSSLGGVSSSPNRAFGNQKDASSPSRAGSQSPAAVHILASESSPQVNGTSQAQPVSGMPPSGTSPLQHQVQPFATSNGITVSSPLPLGVPSSTSQPQYPPGMKIPQQADVSPLAQQQQAVQSQRPLSASQQMPPSRTSNASAFPGTLQDLVSSFESVKQKAPLRMSNVDQVHKLLDNGFANVPQPYEAEKPKYYVPRNPYPVPNYYPQSPIPLLNQPWVYQVFEVETLFFVFYYLPGTYQQYLAAKELKRQSWRFHIKYMTWFQRHSEPQAITEEYEQGVYVYFDWEGSWCQRKKSDFRFEYRYLSED